MYSAKFIANSSLFYIMKRLFAFSAFAFCLFPCFASDTPPPVLKGVTVSNNVKTITFTPAPAIDQYVVKSNANVAAPFATDASAVLSGTSFRVTNTQPVNFYTVGATPMSSNSLLTANLLNRIAYGPTPDDLARLASIGPQAYINEQLAAETIASTFDTYVIHATNSGSTPPVTGWQQVTVAGTFTANTIYLYLTQIGSAYIDDVELRLLNNNYVTNVVGTNIVITTNVIVGTNLLVNGDFEAGTLAPWGVATNMTSSTLTTGQKHSGNQSLLAVATFPGNTSFNSIFQTFFTPRTPNANATNRCQLSFWYLPANNSSRIQARLSGSGTIATGSDEAPEPGWVYATATGGANTTPTIYLYLNAAGTCYIDDIQLVAGSVPEVGPNLVRNGDFEAPLSTNNWNKTADFTNSSLSTTYAHSGASSLRLVATAGGSGNNDSIFQTNLPVVNNGIYTVSFWYLPAPPTQARQSTTLTVRLSGSLLTATPDSSAAGVRRRLENIGSRDAFTGQPDDVPYSTAGLSDLRAWFAMNAVGSPRQLIEILTQFLENHFVTQNSKSRDYTDGRYNNGTLEDAITTEWEYREVSRWRQALLSANCTFYDLLKISAESPAMIVYLDTVGSAGNGAAVANENYARELFELFTMGVDNGYDQNDIIVMSRAWTGWTVDIVDFENINNPFATRTLRNGMYPGVGSGTVSNLVGIWTFVFNSAVHGTNRAPILSEWDPTGPVTSPRPLGSGSYPYAGGQSKIVPARFGAPWAGTPYRLVIPPGRTGTNGIQDGYDVLNHLANLPFTMEFISVKLCRLFVHDDFVHGIYDYTDPNRSAEAELVRQCMVAWNAPAGDGRRGNIRSVLTTIFNSDLFRSHGGSLQKVKTPLEFVASSIRATRARNANGTFTASTDGYSFNSPLSRMGGMNLFNRAEPDGYPEAGPPWISAGTLDERVRFVQALLNAGTGDDAGNCVTDPVALLKLKLPSNQWNNAGNVADYFLSIIYPGEGKANLDAYRNLAMNFLNTSDTGGSDLFTALNNAQTTYDTRVRGMVSMLMTLQRFQEQ
jgi:uncharacterized protein (DUF1800 family)